MSDYTTKPVWVTTRGKTTRYPTILAAARATGADYDQLAQAVRMGYSEYAGFQISTHYHKVRHVVSEFWTPGTPLLRGHCTHRLGAYHGEGV